MGIKMVSAFMISRNRLATLALLPVVFFIIEVACNRVPLTAPSGSSITLTTATTVIPVNGSATIVATVVENAGTPPQAGTHVFFTTSLGTIQPSDTTTDSAGRATATLTVPSSGTASVAATSGGASTGSTPLKILVGSAAVQKVVVNATPATVPALGGSTTISATVFDLNGALMPGIPVTFTTTAGTLSAAVANTDNGGVASSTLTTAQTATVTANVGVGTSTTPTTPTTPSTGGTTPSTPSTPSASGQASGSVTVNIAAAPTIVITPPSSAPSAGLPANFTIAVTPAAQNGSAIKAVTVEWGDTTATELGSITGNAVVSHVYEKTGSYLVRASATDAAGNTTSVSSVVTVIPVAHPGISIQATGAGAGTKRVNFTITITIPNGLNIQNVEIDYDNSGNFVSLGGAPGGSVTTNHTYAAAGDYTVKVRVTDSSGGTTEATTVVTAP